MDSKSALNLKGYSFLPAPFSPRCTPPLCFSYSFPFSVIYRKPVVPPRTSISLSWSASSPFPFAQMGTCLRYYLLFPASSPPPKLDFFSSLLLKRKIFQFAVPMRSIGFSRDQLSACPDLVYTFPHETLLPVEHPESGGVPTHHSVRC